MRPVIFRGGILDWFTASNKWVNSYCYNFKQIGEYRSAKRGRFLLLLAKLGEIILSNPAGDFVEKVLKNIQQRRIKKNPATYESGGRIIFTDNELEFHPRSFEKVVISKYNNGLEKIGIVPCSKETDSGLKQ